MPRLFPEESCVRARTSYSRSQKLGERKRGLDETVDLRDFSLVMLTEARSTLTGRSGELGGLRQSKCGRENYQARKRVSNHLKACPTNLKLSSPLSFS